MRTKGLFIIAFVLFAASACSKTTATTGAPPTTETVVPTPNVEAPSTTKPADLVEAEPELDTLDGLEVLYIGHSFGKPFAQNLEAAAQLTGIEGHEQHIIFRGGENGAPQAMWEAPDQQTIIKERLDTGTVDVVVMICCSQEFKETGGQSDQAILGTSSYALEQNPDTRIGLTMPWADYPSTYPSVDEHRALTDAAWPPYQQLAEDIGDELGAEVFALYHGAAIYEVRHWLEQGLLADANSLIGSRESAVFRDDKGHAGNLALDAGTLIWLYAIYGVDPLDAPALGDHDVNVGEIASAALSQLTP